MCPKLSNEEKTEMKQAYNDNKWEQGVQLCQVGFEMSAKDLHTFKTADNPQDSQLTGVLLLVHNDNPMGGLNNNRIYLDGCSTFNQFVNPKLLTDIHHAATYRYGHYNPQTRRGYMDLLNAGYMKRGLLIYWVYLSSRPLVTVSRMIVMTTSIL